ncbi:MAG: hypothetical protein H6834_15385 [Planctomycetes bacterium]|nr:hypothetical protein [Planctomycetota bacterium]
MSEFTEIIKEAFVGEGAFDPTPGRDALEAAVQKYDRRMRTVRWLAWFMVAAMTVVGVIAAIAFANAEAPLGKEHLAYAALFTIAYVGIGIGKMFLLFQQNHLSLMKELKRVELMILDGR